MDSDEAEVLLGSGPDGVADWNRRRNSGEQQPLQFRPGAFADPNRYSLDMQGVDLGGCSLVASKLWNANLKGAHLYQTDFSGALLSRAELVGAHLVGARLDGAALGGARLDHAELREASLRDVSVAGYESGASFHRALAERADLGGAELRACDFSHADLREAVFLGAQLVDSRFDGADLFGADLRGADLRETSFVGANLDGADFRDADLGNADLREARMIGSRLEGANLAGCSVYGISAWDLHIDDNTVQRDLSIGRRGHAAITVDDLEVAQFMYLLMNNVRLRRVIDTITSKVVLILGRFTPERKPLLDELREALRGGRFDFVPIVFDFDKPASRTTAETVATLAGMARFVIADLTDAKSILQELREIVPSSPSLPVQPLLLESQDEPGMLDFFHRYPWFLAPHLYRDGNDLLARLDEVVEAAVDMSDELRGAGK